MQDAALQKFFHDIAEQLQLIGSASPRSSIAMDSPTLSQGENSTPNTPNLAQAQAPAQTGSATPTVMRPVPTRAMSDQPTMPPRIGIEPVRRRSYLGDASSRENTVAAHGHSAQMVGEKVRKTLPAPMESKRKSRRESMLLPVL